MKRVSDSYHYFLDCNFQLHLLDLAVGQINTKGLHYLLFCTLNSASYFCVCQQVYPIPFRNIMSFVRQR